MPKPSRQAFTLIQLVLAVIVMAAIIRVALHFENGPAVRTVMPPLVEKNDKLMERHNADPGVFKGRFLRESLVPEDPCPQTPTLDAPGPSEAPTAFIPLRRPVADGQGPLLARVVGRVHPSFTDRQVSDLVGTLPPCETPPTVLILPSTEKPTDEDKSRDPRTRDNGCEPSPCEQDG